VGRVIAQTADGSDLEDILKERKQELEMMKGMGLKFDTDPSTVKDPNVPPPTTQPDDEEPDETDPTVKSAEKMLRTMRREALTEIDAFAANSLRRQLETDRRSHA